MKPASEIIKKIIKKSIISKYPPYFAEIILSWDKIASPFSKKCYPTKVLTYKEKLYTKNKLYVEVSDSSYNLQLHFHKGVLIERI